MIDGRHALPHLDTDHFKSYGAFSFDDIARLPSVSPVDGLGMRGIAAHPAPGIETPKTSNSFSTDTSSTRPSLISYFDPTPVPIDFGSGLPSYEPLPDVPYEQVSVLGDERNLGSSQLDFSDIMNNGKRD